MKKMTVGAICLAIGMLVVGCTSAKYYRQENQRLREEHISLTQENTALKSDLARLYASNERLLEQMKERSKGSSVPATQPAPATAIKHLEEKGLEFVWREGCPAVVLSGLFAPGRTTLSDKGKKMLKQTGDTIKQELPAARLRVDGYTDNQPITKSKEFKSNRELSAARAKNVAEFLITECGYPEARITAQGLGEENPLADNNTHEGREKNRRVEIVILIK